jgi:hypothetical protein
MTDSHSCPLCTEAYHDRTDLRVHLEVNHRKSEVVSHLVDLDARVADALADYDGPTVEDEQPMPSP